MTAVGVARPRAQGQATTTTLMPNSSANMKGVCPSGSQLSGYVPASPAKYLHPRWTEHQSKRPGVQVVFTCLPAKQTAGEFVEFNIAHVPRKR